MFRFLGLCSGMLVRFSRVVKISVLPYWKMLSTLLRQGNPAVMLEFTNEPIYWDGTFFGNSNVWENAWTSGDTHEFNATKVFLPRSQWDTTSPPEIYVPRELPIANTLLKIHTILEEERVELKNCMQRLGFRGVDVFTAGFSFPFPSAGRDDYIKSLPRAVTGALVMAHSLHRFMYAEYSPESFIRAIQEFIAALEPPVQPDFVEWMKRVEERNRFKTDFAATKREMAKSMDIAF